MPLGFAEEDLETEQISQNTANKREISITVIGDSEIAEHHYLGWRMCGINATRRKSGIVSFGDTDYVDICEDDPSKKKQTLVMALRKKCRVLTFEPIASTEKISRNLITEFRTQGIEFLVIDPVTFNPLVTKARELISSGNLGKPGVLRLELINYEKRKTNNVLSQSVIYSIRIAALLFGGQKIHEIYSSFVKTETSGFHVIVGKFGGGEVAHIVAGHSTAKSSFEFSLNGSKGMLNSKNEDVPKISDSSRNFSSENLWNKEVLSNTFQSFLQGKDNGRGFEELSQGHKWLGAVNESSTTGKAISISDV